MNVLIVRDSVANQGDLLPALASELRRLGSHRCRLVWDGRPQFKHQMWALGLPTAIASLRMVRVRPRERFAPVRSSTRPLLPGLAARLRGKLLTRSAGYRTAPRTPISVDVEEADIFGLNSERSGP